jgi:hypothetical protein
MREKERKQTQRVDRSLHELTVGLDVSFSFRFAVFVRGFPVSSGLKLFLSLILDG